MDSEPSLSIEERKILAEIAKLEAEARVISEELGRPWFRKRYFFQAITAGLVALPLVWFYFEKVALPLNRIENIKQELSNAVEQKKLASRNDQLEKEALNQKRKADDFIAVHRKLIAQVQEDQKIIAAIQVKLASMEQSKLVTLQQSLRVSSARASQLEADINEALFDSLQILEMPGHNFQTLQYRPVTSIVGKTYQRGLFLDSQNTSPSSVSYRIPRGAKFFVATAIARDAGECGGGGNVNGWSITITTPKARAAADNLSWNYRDPKILCVPVDNIPAGGIKELTITVNPNSDRTCDHPALGDPHFAAKEEPGCS